MFVVIFRAKVRHTDNEYAQVAVRMRELALGQFGCLELTAVTEGQDEIALSYWPSEKHIQAWKPARLATGAGVCLCQRLC